MVVSRKILEDQLIRTLGRGCLPELSKIINRVDLFEPEKGQLFWRSQDAESTLCIVLQGKVRVIDRDNNLVISLPPGTSFGELTLFADSDFQPYSIRASSNTFSVM